MVGLLTRRQTGGQDIQWHLPGTTVGNRSPAAALTGDMSAEAALTQIIADCRASVGNNRLRVLASDDPDGIHQVRVALRRLRAAVGLFRDAVADPRLQVIDREARYFANACGPVRDLHVFLSETAPDAPSGVRRTGRELAKQKLGRARSTLHDARFFEFDRMLESFAVTAHGQDRETLMSFSRCALDMCESKVRSRGRHLTELTAKRLHRLRIAIKKLRYAVGFLAPIFDSQDAQGYIEAVVTLQDALGKLNDRTVGARVLADIGKASRPSDKVKKSYRRLAKRLNGEPRGRDKRHLELAWKTFKKTQPFWRQHAIH